MYICMHVCMYARMYVCMYMGMCILFLFGGRGMDYYYLFIFVLSVFWREGVLAPAFFTVFFRRACSKDLRVPRRVLLSILMT